MHRTTGLVPMRHRVEVKEERHIAGLEAHPMTVVRERRTVAWGARRHIAAGEEVRRTAAKRRTVEPVVHHTADRTVVAKLHTAEAEGHRIVEVEERPIAVGVGRTRGRSGTDCTCERGRGAELAV